MADVEDGWPISKLTACRVGAHTFIYAGPLPPLVLRCDCGATTYPHEPPPRPR